MCNPPSAALHCSTFKGRRRRTTLLTSRRSPISASQRTADWIASIGLRNVTS